MSDKNDNDDGTVKFPEKKDRQSNTDVLPALPLLDYPSMLRNAHISVVRNVLKIIESDYEPGKFNIEITFDMGHPDTESPSWVFEQYNNLMTIVLNQRYDGLHITNDYIEVTVYFNGHAAELLIPFDSITIFRDLNADITFGFGNARVKEKKIDKEALEGLEVIEAEIVSLDDFRKKD